MNILPKINNPDDVKKLSDRQLEVLSREIRETIINTVAKNGGHLAPSLGTVELSIALHKVFNSPTDKIVWDVGHQAYAHKLLTGRFNEFHTLRQKDGITGFPKRKESIHDAFGVGHASTSISAALGMAVARDLKGEDNCVVAVIGDGALTGGEAFEGLNNAGMSKRKLIVILNDNEMSINPNVGAISEYLSLIRVDEKYNRAKKDASKIIKGIPKVGTTIWDTIKKVKKGFVNTFLPGALFEALGFSYLGPVDGNDLFSMITLLEKVKNNMEGPILLHLHTKKGLGYEPAERMPAKYHGVGKFNISTGSSVSKGPKKPSYTEIFAKSLIDIAKADEDVVAITAAMPSGTGLNKFAEVFPERTFDVGIAEEHAVTFAAGLATCGKKPVVAIYSTFMQRAYDQVIHDVAIQQLPVIFALDRAGLVGEDGPTHHGVFDMAFMRAIPNMIVMAPKDENELRQMLYSATKYDNPVVIRYPRGSALGVELDDEFKLLHIGKGEVLKASPQDEVLILPIGSMVKYAVDAAEELAAENIHCTVINPRFIKPLDKELILENIKGKKLILTVEEGVKKAGFNGAISELLYEEGVYSIPLLGLGIEDKFVEQATHDELLEICGLNTAGIVKTIKDNL